MIYNILIASPLLIVLIVLVYTIGRSIGRLWLDHRVKLALLEKLEKNPDLVSSMDDLQELLDSPETLEQQPFRQDLLIVGVVLAVLGALFAVYFGNLGRGQTAVGAYIGGVVCVVLGFLLALIGLLARYLSRPPKEKGNLVSRLQRKIMGSSDLDE